MNFQVCFPSNPSIKGPDIMRLLTTRDSPRHRSSVWGTPVFVAGFPVNNVWNIFYAPFSMHKNDRASGLERTLRVRSEVFDRDLPHRGAAGQFCANGMSENGSKHFGHCGRIVREYEGGNQPRVTVHVVRALGERPRSEGSSMVCLVDRGHLHTCLRPGPGSQSPSLFLLIASAIFSTTCTIPLCVSPTGSLLFAPNLR